MKIVAYDSARVTALFPFEEIAPLNKAATAQVINRTAERYHFTKRPDLTLSRAELDKIGLKFEIGSAVINGNSVSITEFTIFSDGIVISSNTTQEAEIFWDDLIIWMQATNGFRSFTQEPTKRFISQIIVEFDRPMSGFLKSYNYVSEIISRQLGKIYKAEVPMQFSRIDLEYDRVGAGTALTVPKFIIERRSGIPFHLERYYCSASMRTEDHIEVLEQIEATLD